MYDRSWTVLLNTANQIESFAIPVPNAEGWRYRIRAWIGGNSAGVNVLLFENELTLAQIQNMLTAGLVDAITVIPRGGVAEVESEAIHYLTVAADAAIGAGTSVLVTLRITGIGSPRISPRR